jgi:hypothetical protein
MLRAVFNASEARDTMHLPNRLYESLPLLYAVGGVMAIAWLGLRPLVVVSSLTLVGAAALIHQRRRAYRLRMAQQKARGGRGRRTTSFAPF